MKASSRTVETGGERPPKNGPLRRAFWNAELREDRGSVGYLRPRANGDISPAKETSYPTLS
jgi:hypothetical protein